MPTILSKRAGGGNVFFSQMRISSWGRFSPHSVHSLLSVGNVGLLVVQHLLLPTLPDMQSQGSTSSQPSFDSLSSSDSLLFSDSEQAEDDADVFLTDGSSSSSSSVIIDGIGRGRGAKGNRSLESPASQWICDSFTDKEEEEESYTSGRGRKEPHRNLGSAARQAPRSEGDLLFAHKVRTAEQVDG